MSSPHLIDPSRLDILKAQRDAVFGASTQVSETIRDLSQQKSRIASEISRINSDASSGRGFIDRAEREKKVAEYNAQIKKIEADMQKAKTEQEPLNERRQAIGTLFSRCAEYLGVNPYDR